MKILLVTLIAIAACANKDRPAIAAETENPCHLPIKIVDTGDKFLFILNCKPSEPVEFIKPLDGKPGKDGSKGDKGDKGSTGRTGSTGAKGDQGDSAEEIYGVVCNHGRDHIDRTLSISTSDLVFSKWGIASEFDYPGPCENQGQCSCDACPSFATPTENIRIIHRKIQDN
jgi:hypothetical protein